MPISQLGYVLLIKILSHMEGVSITRPLPLQQEKAFTELAFASRDRYIFPAILQYFFFAKEGRQSSPSIIVDVLYQLLITSPSSVFLNLSNLKKHELQSTLELEITHLKVVEVEKCCLILCLCTSKHT